MIVNSGGIESIHAPQPTHVHLDLTEVVERRSYLTVSHIKTVYDIP